MKKYTDKQIDELANILIKDGVICVPTDTVYGLCTSINSETGYKKLIKLKRRPLNKQIPIMCSDKRQLEKICQIDKNAEKLINTFMPGPITLILKKRKNIDLLDNSSTVAIRIASSNTLQELITKSKYPIYMTSANISGENPYDSLDEIEKKMPQLDGILKGKPKFGVASTIVDCSDENIKILRQGPITKEEIDKVLKEV